MASLLKAFQEGLRFTNLLRSRTADILKRLDSITWEMFKAMFPNDYAPESLDYKP